MLEKFPYSSFFVLHIFKADIKEKDEADYLVCLCY